jgi:hypothetical protein
LQIASPTFLVAISIQGMVTACLLDRGQSDEYCQAKASIRAAILSSCSILALKESMSRYWQQGLDGQKVLLS